LENFKPLLEEKLLFWFEALSLTRNLGLASAAFSVLKLWLASSQDVSIIIDSMKMQTADNMIMTGFSDRTRQTEVIC
jgi:hypothetical protein